MYITVFQWKQVEQSIEFSRNTIFKFRALRLAQIKSISSSDRLLIHFSLTGGTVKHMRRQGYKVGEEGLQTQPFRPSLPVTSRGDLQ